MRGKKYLETIFAFPLEVSQQCKRNLIAWLKKMSKNYCNTIHSNQPAEKIKIKRNKHKLLFIDAYIYNQ